MLADSQNGSDFDNLWVKKISSNKRLWGGIIHVCQDNDKGDQKII